MAPFVAYAGVIRVDPNHRFRFKGTCNWCSWWVSLDTYDGTETLLAIHLLRDHGALACQLLGGLTLPVVEPLVESHWP